MKVIAVEKAGQPDVLKIVDLPKPVPQKHEIVIEQIFAGVNYGDVIRRKRGIFKLNRYGYFIPGFEGVGKVISVGDAVKDYNIGDRVSYLIESGGGYSQQICLDERFVYHVPDEISSETAAAMSCVGITAWNLIELSGVKVNDWVVIHGATGGVGLLLVQLCLLKGAKVIAIVGTSKKKDFLKRYSPTAVIVKDESDVISEIKSITDGKDIDIIFDCVGKDVLEINLSCIRKGGTILYYGSTSGHSEFSGMHVLMNSLKIQGFNVFNLIEETSVWKKSICELITFISEHKLDIYIDRIFNMEQVCDSHKLLESRGSLGKLIIDLR